MNQPNLGKKIVELRKALSMTQEELANQTGVSVRTIQRIEQGDVTPRLATVKLLSEALDYDLNGEATNGRIDKTIIFFIHLSSIFIFVFFPIIVLIWNKSMSKTIEIEAKRAINFQISYLINILLALTILLLGILYTPLMIIGTILLILCPIVYSMVCIRNMIMLNNQVKAKYLYEINYLKVESK